MSLGISNDYIRGLIDGEGCFTFETSRYFLPDGTPAKRKIPAFRLQMNERDKALLFGIKIALGLKNKIHEVGPYRKDGINRGKQVILAVRDLGQLKNVIIPLFYGNRLIGHKRNQFNAWLERMGTDSDVGESYRLLYRLHKAGYFQREIRQGGLFEEFVD